MNLSGLNRSELFVSTNLNVLFNNSFFQFPFLAFDWILSGSRGKTQIRNFGSPSRHLCTQIRQRTSCIVLCLRNILRGTSAGAPWCWGSWNKAYTLIRLLKKTIYLWGTVGLPRGYSCCQPGMARTLSAFLAAGTCPRDRAGGVHRDNSIRGCMVCRTWLPKVRRVFDSCSNSHYRSIHVFSLKPKIIWNPRVNGTELLLTIISRINQIHVSIHKNQPHLLWYSLWAVPSLNEFSLLFAWYVSG